MWQPNRAQWGIIWAAALLLILSWPPAEGRSLLVKAANWIVDPSDSLPRLPAPLPMGLEDNGDAVAEHDAAATEYYRQYRELGGDALADADERGRRPAVSADRTADARGSGSRRRLMIWRLQAGTVAIWSSGHRIIGVTSIDQSMTK